MPLPEATVRPCNDCPWRRESAPGWLGPSTSQEWVEMAHGEVPIACHLTITNESWDDDGIKQCGGAAIYRANVCKKPRNSEIIVGNPDREKVFSRSTEFLAHHAMPTKRLLANHVLCDDCDELVPLDYDMEPSDAIDELCPNDDSHFVHPVHTSERPLGRPDDHGSFDYGLDLYVYELEMD